MSADPRLENYLSTLDRALSSLPVSDRAEIVTEIKSHVLSALERDPEQSLDSVLAALGEPEVVANRYLLERGMKPGKPPVSPVVKWIVIGFLGTMALGLAAVVALVMFLSPMIKVDGNKEKVSMLGGLVEVDGDNIHIGTKLVTFKGGYAASGKEKPLSLQFANGRMELANSKDGSFHWECKGTGILHGGHEPQVKEGALDLSDLDSARCSLEVPKAGAISVSGLNGKIDLNEPNFSATIDLTNGKVGIEPDEKARYRFDLAVTAGKIDSFDSSNNPEYQIRVHLLNGKISRN
jgi:hypothetical protein